MLKLSRLFILTTALVISGCQTLPLGHSTAEKLKIDSPSIGYITKKADIEVTYSSNSTVLVRQHHKGLAYLPHTLALPELNQSQPVTAQVKVKLEGKELMHGEQILFSDKEGLLLLQSNFDGNLTNTYWLAESVSGRGIPPYVKTTIGFSNDGRLRGFAGCNRFKGHYQSEAVLLEVAEVVTTRQLCSSPAMVHEQRFLNDLRKVEYFKMQEGKLLLYTREQEQPMVFRATNQQQVRLSMLRDQ